MRAGLSYKQLQGRCRSGDLFRPFPSVYALGGIPLSDEGRLLGAILAAGAWAGAAGASSAALHELEGFVLGTPEIVVRSGWRCPGVLVHRITQAETLALELVKGIPTTGVARTILDLAAARPLPEVGRALDDALRRKQLTVSTAWDELEATGGQGRLGTRAMRKLLWLRDPRDEAVASKFEARLLRILKLIGREPFEPQYEIFDRGRFVARPDFAFPARRVAVEAHSFRWHSDVDRWSRDVRRDRALRRLGWTVLYFTYEDVFRHPNEVQAEIQDALDAKFSTDWPGAGESVENFVAG